MQTIPRGVGRPRAVSRRPMTGVLRPGKWCAANTAREHRGPHLRLVVGATHSGSDQASSIVAAQDPGEYSDREWCKRCEEFSLQALNDVELIELHLAFGDRAPIPAAATSIPRGHASIHREDRRANGLQFDWLVASAETQLGVPDIQDDQEWRLPPYGRHRPPDNFVTLSHHRQDAICFRNGMEAL